MIRYVLAGLLALAVLAPVARGQTDINKVNGPIQVGAGERVAHDIVTVNGSLILEEGADVGGTISNVSGGIRLTRAHVGGDIRTTNGDIEIGPGSRIDGGIHVNVPSIGQFFSRNARTTPRIVIGPDVIVQGPLHFEREVELFVSDRARTGSVEGAKSVHFSGDHPPS